MSILIRVDSSHQIGTGHFMRCLSLADEISRHNVSVTFISASMESHLVDMILERGFQFFMLSQSSGLKNISTKLRHSDWLRGSQAEDARACMNVIGNQVFDWLIVDHYALDISWERLMQNTAKAIMVIDDLADREHDCDVLLDQNFYLNMDNRYSNLVPEHCRVLLGPKYTLLRKEFGELREKVKVRESEVNNILISFGGVDVDNDTTLAINAVRALGPQFKATVVIGKHHRFKEKITEMCNSFGYDLHVQTNQMGALMLKSQLSISSGGATIWERSCLGLPSIVYPIAFNQEKQIDDLAISGYLYKIEKEEIQIERLVMHLKALITNKLLRASLSSRGMRLVDGKGVSRVLNSLGYSDISIRNATFSDIQDLYEWRNHLSIRNVSYNTDPIDFDTHQKWFNSVIDSPQIELLIGEFQNCRVGVVRFDITANVAEVSIYLVPGENGRGFGSRLLLAAETWAKNNIKGLTQFRAEVIKNNDSSHRLFSSNGYSLDVSKYSKQISF